MGSNIDKQDNSQGEMAANPHSALFHAIMGDPERAGTLIRDSLPPDLRERVRTTPPRVIEGTFIDQELRSSQTDKLFEVDLTSGKTALVHALLTNKTEHWMALQTMKYRIRIWERYAQDNPAVERLPIIIPLVFEADSHPWATLVNGQSNWARH